MTNKKRFCRSQLITIKSALVASTLVAAPVIYADAPSEIADARSNWVAGNVGNALGHLESAIAQEPANAEANFLIAIVKLASLFESSEFSTLVASAGIQNFNDDIFNLSGDIDYYLETEVSSFSDAAWVRDTTISSDNDDSARSGQISDSQSSIMQTTFTGPGVVEFDYRLSTEEFYDYLDVFVDEVFVDSFSGIQDWQSTAINLPEARDYEISWIYRKDFTLREGEDAVWIDNVLFTPNELIQSLEFAPDSELADALDLAQEVRSGAGAITTEVLTEDPIFAETFSMAEVASWLHDSVLPTLQESIDHLDQVTDTNFLINLSALETRDESLNLDYADARGIQAILEAVSALILVVNEHNVDLLLRAVGDREYIELPTPRELYNPDGTSVHAQWLFSTFPQMFALNPDADFSNAKSKILEFWEVYQEAADLILARTSDAKRLFNSVESVNVPGSQWFAQSVFTRDGEDAAQAGESDCFQSPSTLTLEISGPGDLDFSAYLTDVDGFGFPSHFIEIYALDQNGFRSYQDSVYFDVLPQWENYSLIIESDTIALEFIYYNCSSNEMNTAFVDQMSFTPSGGSGVLEAINLDDLDLALDGSFNAFSEPALESTDLRLSQRSDQDFRAEFLRFLDSLDAIIASEGDAFTMAPYFAGEVDPAKLRPIFYSNFAIQGTFPEPTLGGIFPDFTQSQIGERFAQFIPEYDMFNDRLFSREDIRLFFGPFLEPVSVGVDPGTTQPSAPGDVLSMAATETESPIIYVYYDTYFDFDTVVQLERSSGLDGPWRHLGDGLDPVPFDMTAFELSPSFSELEYHDLLYDGKGFYRLTFNFGNAPLTD